MKGAVLGFSRFLGRGTPGFIVTFLVTLIGNGYEEADWNTS
jgi:hypothetical protein